MYRAGNRRTFEESLHDPSPWYRARTWTDLYAVFRRHGEARPWKQQVISELPLDGKLNFLNNLATSAVLRGNLPKGLLE
jgi:hypothetical protein